MATPAEEELAGAPERVPALERVPELVPEPRTAH
jgi:hypothetical protein